MDEYSQLTQTVNKDSMLLYVYCSRYWWSLPSVDTDAFIEVYSK